MPLTFPRKFTHGRKVKGSDVYGELYIWPEGYFHYMVHIRGHDARAGCGVNVTFVLLDAHGAPIGTYGHFPEQEWCVGPGAEGLSSQRYDELFGQIPRDKLAQAETVALVFRAREEITDPAALKGMASRGGELEFCPCPD